MERSLIVVFPGLPDRFAARIRETAESRGFTCRIFEHTSESLPFLENAEVILSNDPALSRNAPNLRWICSTFAGADAFMAPDAFANPAALLSNSSGAYGLTISEHVIMVLLEILRRQPEYQAHMRNREWVRRLPVRSIHGSRVTLLGTGKIGQETLRKLEGFDPAEVVGINRSGRNPGGLFSRVLKSTELDRILPETDILVISLPGTRETRHLLSAPLLKLLPDDAVIVNVGRGSVVDQEALEKELRSSRLFAALDVFEQEPVPPDSTLWTCPRLVLTPHVSGDLSLPYTVEKVVSLFLEDFENYCAGRPLLRLVDREAGY